jgi:hypothetical protein
MKEGWGGSYRGRSGERLGVQVPTKPEAPRRVLGMVQDTQTINQGRMEGGRVGEREEGHTPKWNGRGVREEVPCAVGSWRSHLGGV